MSSENLEAENFDFTMINDTPFCLFQDENEENFLLSGAGFYHQSDTGWTQIPMDIGTIRDFSRFGDNQFVLLADDQVLSL